MKNKHIFIKILFCLLIAILIFVFIMFLSNLNNYKKAKKYDGKVKTPTIDFVQGWLLESFEDEDYPLYIEELKKCGYDTVILQYTVEGTKDSGKSYYESDQLNNYFNNLECSQCLEKLIDACDNSDMNLFIGLSSENSYWNESKYNDLNYLKDIAELESIIIDEINQKFGNHKSFIGWYMAYEFFSNPIGWEKKWIEFTNLIINKLDSLNDNKPLMLSPFRHFLFGNLTNEKRLWTKFIEGVNFRPGDIFSPQDSLGKITSKDITKNSIGTVYRYIKNLSEVVRKKDGLKFYTNVEMFTKDDFFASSLRIGDFERIKLQINIASMFSDEVVSFSFSHMALTYGTYETDDDRMKFYNSFKELYENNKW